ncbi:MAG: S1 RNA-binding domain-containing protein [Anaerolineaceae bacterium]|nr:S1 RNA-binding domain-containing protein [Anaerolineaceae bacterium]
MSENYNNGLNNLEDDSNNLDEGWWSSIIDEEESFIYGKDSQSIDKKEKFLIQNKIIGSVDWAIISSIIDKDKAIEVKVNSFNRGGLLVNGMGVQGFVPDSHLVNVPYDCDEEQRMIYFQEYLNRTIKVKIIECEPSTERVVLSERAGLAGTGKRNALLKSLSQNDVVEGTVTNVTDFGVFVDLGGIEGLIHVSELSWGRVQHPSDILHVGSITKASVLQMSEGNTRIALSLKRLTPNPWKSLDKIIKPGDILPAVVTGMLPYGVFARINEGIEGLIHISSMDMPLNFQLKDYLKVGQKIQVCVLHIDSQKKRLGLKLEKKD